MTMKTHTYNYLYLLELYFLILFHQTKKKLSTKISSSIKFNDLEFMLQKIEDLEMETNAMRNELFILWNKAISATNNPADNYVRVLH